jgi:hypothetical protein
MNNQENNKYRMYLTTDKTLQENASLWTGILAIEAAKTQLNSNIVAIEGYSSSRENDPSGQTLVKHQSREQLEKTLQKVIGGMMGYATAERLVELKQNIHYSPWQLKKATDNRLCDIANAVYVASLPYTEKLSPFLVSSTDFEALNALSIAFLRTIPGKRVASGANTASMKAMKLLFRDTDKLLNDTIDDLLVMYRGPQPDFYNKYLASRVIVDLGHGKKAGKAPKCSPEDGKTA